MGMKRWKTYGTTIGLIAVLLAMTAFALWAALTSRDLARHAHQASALNDQYQQATYWLSEENRYETLYRLHPTPANEQLYLQAGSNFLTAMRQSERLSNIQDDAFINVILSQHARYQALVQQEFTALVLEEQAQFTEASAESDRVIADMEQQVQQEAQKNHALALQRLGALDDTQQLLSVATPLIFVPGMALVLACLSFLHISQRREQHALQVTMERQLEEAALQAELARLQQSALTDNLTNLGNHRAYQEAYHREMAQAQRHQEVFSLALVDVDEFKQCNDQFGHAYGDHILTTLATILQGTPDRGQAFRLGGDEFAVLLRHTSMEEATGDLEAIRAEAQKALAGVTISIGIAALSPEADNALVLQEQADAALYEAKRRGRNALATFTEIEDHITLLTSEQAQAVRRLLTEKKVTIMFQPIWDLPRNAILGYEALMRPDAGYGLAGPQQAFDIAERMGHIHELDAVCREATLASAQALPDHALLFMNVCPQTLDHDLMAGDSLVVAVQQAGLRPEQVVLEITERAIARPDVVIREATRLRELGFRLALDDVGAGNSGLEMLSHLAVDFVKIDRAVVVHAPHDTAARAVLAGIVAIARETQSYVIAEGIEDVATLQFIESIGAIEIGTVRGVQGYLLGRPSPVMVPGEQFQIAA